SEKGKPKSFTENETGRMKQAVINLLLMTQWLQPKPLRLRKEWVGLKRVDVIEVDAEGWRVDYYIDSKTKLPIKVAYGYSELERAKGKLTYEVRLEDYKEISGIMMPHKVTPSFTDAPPLPKQKATYELNVDYDEQIFERPPSPTMKPDAWRAKAASR
ncbi:MAG TPA: hypothetical protein VFM05_04505, partial [Candidatus Saccharimonadales bacterium]|nr:hypothetical protein [Candidatus Saccharimonadales bacterium]